MRWFASAFALGLMMALFHRLTAGGALEARATLALGFLLLAAQLGGDIARRARLPRITGYLLTGFAVGPAWLGLVRADEVGALRLIGDAAVALIAFAAGSELTLDTLRRERVGLTRLAGGTILFPFAAVAAVMFSVGLWFPVTVHQPVGDRVTVALVLGTVAAASSPVVTMAVIGELDARGPFARAVLAVSVAQDVAVIVLLSLVLAVARLVTSAGAVNLLVAGTALAHLVGSVAVGAALGLAAVARRAFPEWGVSLETLIVAMIGVHELVGPICFRRALRLAGEVREGEHGRENAEPDRAVLAPGGGV